MHLARETIKAEKRFNDALPNEGLEDGPDEYVVPLKLRENPTP